MIVMQGDCNKIGTARRPFPTNFFGLVVGYDLRIIPLFLPSHSSPKGRTKTVKEPVFSCLPLTREVAKTKFLTEGEKMLTIVFLNNQIGKLRYL